ncbi:MAG: hypothetical protein PHT64_03305 [Bacteroidales bacterium]|nr:hypothetical protein [Bacteroidales bacterium]MDD4030218.1 hypothetical protein [Bacteroidales bacterium]MDD4435144.1 hypothetical protein [Bacteroidales bacterium]MDD5732806.1 hypothetical protein [Bacteroidales bacterium]
MKANNDKWIHTIRNRMDQAPVSFDTGASWIHMEQKVRRFYRIRLWRRVGLSAACAAAIVIPLIFLIREEATNMFQPVRVIELRYKGTILSHRADRPRRLYDTDSEHRTAKVTGITAGDVSAEHATPVALTAEQPGKEAATDTKPAKNETPVSGTTDQPSKQTVTRSSEENIFQEPDNRVNKRKKMMLAASGLLSVNETGKMSSLPAGDAFMYENRLIGTGILQNNATLNGDQATFLPMNYVTYEYKHRLPVSFGIVASFPLSERWYVESGLFATRLASSMYMVHFMSQNDPVFLTDRVLWYLGVPLKISWNFLQGRYFTAYASAGGAVEKCIYFGYEQAMEDEKMQLTPRDLPLMWSVQVTFGAQYNIVNGVGLFAEPGISFYPENKKMPVNTIRTDKPLNFNINAGLRFTF